MQPSCGDGEEVDWVFLVLVVGNNVTEDEAEVIDFLIQLPANER